MADLQQLLLTQHDRQSLTHDRRPVRAAGVITNQILTNFNFNMRQAGRTAMGIHGKAHQAPRIGFVVANAQGGIRSKMGQ